MEEIYRACASVLVFRPTDVCSPDGCDTVYQILLLHKPRKNDAWQLPQGGIEEGEELEHAGLRELMEEAGIEAEVIGHSEKFYQYDFPASYRRFRPDNVKGQRIGYVFAVVPKDIAVQVDDDEIDTYAWVIPEQLPQYLKRKEYRKLVEELIAEGTELLRSSV